MIILLSPSTNRLIAPASLIRPGGRPGAMITFSLNTLKNEMEILHIEIATMEEMSRNHLNAEIDDWEEIPANSVFMN